MPVFVVKQTVSHPLSEVVHVKVTQIIGRDLRHAVECVRVPEPMRRDLWKKYWSRTIDPHGRELIIEIIDDKARGKRGMR